jgi:potassium-transporting ATPase KdpC subunit
MRQIGPAIKIYLVLTLITGVIYPVVVTLAGQLLFHRQASGDFVSRGGQPVGSVLIGQKFVSDKYFWGRPSGIDYNPLASGGSNLGPTSEALKKAVKDRFDQVRKVFGLSETAPIPQELLFASGSGLDPEISPAAALFQVDRVAKARGLTDHEKLVQLIRANAIGPDLGFIGEPRVNVLKLNLALDEMSGGGPSH